MELVIWPNDILIKSCKPYLFGDITDCILSGMDSMISGMLAVMIKHGGCGLAAPQVGWNKRVFITTMNDRPEDFRVFINPTITVGGVEETAEEQCLSLPSQRFMVPRWSKVNIISRGMFGQTIQETMTGRMARIVQHENDHLDGKLISRFEPILQNEAI